MPSRLRPDWSWFRIQGGAQTAVDAAPPREYARCWVERGKPLRAREEGTEASKGIRRDADPLLL